MLIHAGSCSHSLGHTLHSAEQVCACMFSADCTLYCTRNKLTTHAPDCFVYSTCNSLEWKWMVNYSWISIHPWTRYTTSLNSFEFEFGGKTESWFLYTPPQQHYLEFFNIDLHICFCRLGGGGGGDTIRDLSIFSISPITTTRKPPFALRDQIMNWNYPVKWIFSKSW